MTEKTVMELADDVMSSMGMSDSVPLSEATSDSIHSVGKTYSEDLPGMTDSQRDKLIAESVSVMESRGPGRAKKETQAIGKMSPKDVHGELQVKQPRKRKKKLKRKEFEFEIATESKEEEAQEQYEEIVNRKKNTWSPQAAMGQSLTTQGDIARLAKLIGQTGKKPTGEKSKTTKENRKPFAGLGEMTTVGALGTGPFGNKPALDPDSPFKKKKRKITSNFIQKSFMK